MKIFNTVFNSFWRTLGRILCYILIGFIIAFIIGKTKVNADTRSNNWVSNIKYLPSNSSVVNWSSPTDFTYFTPASIRASSLFTYDTFGDSAREVYNDNDIIYYMDEVVLGSNGRSFGFTTPYRLFKDQYHAITTYICYSGGDMPQVTRIGAGDSYNTAFSGNVKYKSTTRMYLNWIDLAPDNATTLGYTRLYCGSYFSIIQPIENSFTFNLRMDGVTTKHSYFLMGIDALPLADANQVTPAQIENIVKNSGLATASSVEDVKNSINEVKKQANDINNSINNDDVNDSQNKINGFFNDFSSGDDKGLQDIITMPLKYVNDLGKSCKPVNLPLGKLGNVDLPCLSTSVYKISWLSGIIRVISVIINGLISYKVVKSLLLFIHDLRDPDNDKVEVLDL